MHIILSDNLLQEVQKGNRKAMQQLYSLTASHFYAVAQRYVAHDEDAKDVLQESFIKVFRSIRDYQPKKDASVLSWMNRIVVNESLLWLRSKERLSFMEYTDEMPDQAEELQMERFTAADLHRAIRQLPAGYRMVLNLYAFEDKSHKEIAELLHIKESTSASQLNRAKLQLKKILEKQEGGTR